MYRILLLLCATPLLFGCVSLKPVNTSTVTFKSMQLDTDLFHANSIALLPVLTNEPKFEGLRRHAGNEITKALRLEQSFSNVNDPTYSIRAINDSELTHEYSKLIRSYQTTGILDEIILKKIGVALGSRYLLYTKLRAVSDTEIINYNSAAGSIISSVTQVDIYTQLWDSEIGDIVWEGHGGSAAASGPNDGDLIELAAEYLAVSLGNGVTGSDQTGSAQDIHDKQKSNYYSAYVSFLFVVVAVLLLV